MNNLLIPGSFEVKTAWFPDIFFPNKQKRKRYWVPSKGGWFAQESSADLGVQ